MASILTGITKGVDTVEIDDALVEKIRKTRNEKDKNRLIVVKHMASHVWLKSKIPSLQFLTGDQLERAVQMVMRKYGNMPVCGKCEMPAYRDKGKVTCPHCGWSGDKIKTLRQYVEDKDYL